MKLYRRFVSDRALRTHLIVVSTPSLAFCSRLVEAQEPVRVQALGPELAVERFDEGVVGRFAWSTEVERHVFHVGPQVELLADEFRAVVDTDRLGVAELYGSAFERLDDIASAIAVPDIDCRRHTAQRVHDREHPKLLSVEELVMHEVHGPDVVGRHAPLYPAHEWLLQEGREPRPHGRALYRLVQFRSDAQDPSHVPSNGGGHRSPALGYGGHGKADRRSRSSREKARALCQAGKFKLRHYPPDLRQTYLTLNW